MSEEREQKNAIFAQQQQQQLPPGVDPRMPRSSAAERVKADFGLDVPQEVVPLPSAGKVYSTNSSLYGAELVEIKAMTAREEDILTSRVYLKKGSIITELIKSCLIDKTINPLDLLSGDRNALMVAIRITGYGAEYETEMECPECAVKSPHSFNLGALQVNRLELEPTEAGQNVFEFLLPYSKKNIKFKFMTGRDEEEISALNDRQKKLALGVENSVTTNLLHAIVSIDGTEDRVKISNFIKSMPARDSLALRNYMKDNEPGINMKQETTCNSCGHADEVTMPLGITFLWPSSRR